MEGALHSPSAGRGERWPGVPVSIPTPAKTILSSYQQLCTVTQPYGSKCHHCQQL